MALTRLKQDQSDWLDDVLTLGNQVEIRLMKISNNHSISMVYRYSAKLFFRGWRERVLRPMED